MVRVKSIESGSSAHERPIISTRGTSELSANETETPKPRYDHTLPVISRVKLRRFFRWAKLKTDGNFVDHMQPAIQVRPVS